MAKHNSETRSEKFHRIVEGRVNRAAEQIRLIGNCSNPATYDYSEAEVKMIFSYLEEELRNAKQRFSGGGKNEKQFSFK